MSYNRVIPRDLFNEASLLKCYGRLYIISDTTPGLKVKDNFTTDHEAFCVVQDDSSGATFIDNVVVLVHGEKLHLRRPMNSREAWPLFVEGIGDNFDIDPIVVFDEIGNLSADMERLLYGGAA